MPRAFKSAGYWECGRCSVLHEDKHEAQDCCYEITCMWYRVGGKRGPRFFCRIDAIRVAKQHGSKVYRVTRYRVRK